MIIKIWATDQGDEIDGGWMFDIWEDEDADTENTQSDDGGIFEGSKIDAINFAALVAKGLLKTNCAHVSVMQNGRCDVCNEKEKKPTKAKSIKTTKAIEPKPFTCSEATARRIQNFGAQHPQFHSAELKRWRNLWKRDQSERIHKAPANQ